MTVDIIALEKERLEWSLKIFPDATPLSSLLKLEDEIAEIKTDISVGEKHIVEYADALMCLFDSAGRQGITPDEIFIAFRDKLAINKARKWEKNSNNTYSHLK